MNELHFALCLGIDPLPECSLALTHAPSAAGDYDATLAIFNFEPEPRMVRLVGRAFRPID